MYKQLKYIIPALLGVAFGILAWVRLSAHEALLFAAQEHSLWLSGGQFFSDMLSQPGGIFSWAGCYLTQTFYHPTAGICLLIGLWLSIYALTLWGTKLRWWLSPLGLLPVAMLLWAVTAPTYQIYNLRVPDWWFTPTLLALFLALLIAITRWLPTKVRITIQVLLVLCGIGYTYHWEEACSVPAELRTPFYAADDNANFLTELRMERAAMEGDWKAIIAEARQNKQRPTRQILLFRNAALYNTDRLLAEWGNYPMITELPKLPESIPAIPMTEICGPRLYLLHGALQFAYRWAMEDMVEYGPQVRNLRAMAEVALISGEYDALRKYTSILKMSTFHREEAEQFEHLAQHPEKIASDVRYRKTYILAHKQEDMLDSDNSHCESYLWNHYSTLVNGDVPELNLLCLHFAMHTQDIGHFWNQFFAYVHLHPSDPMPKILQEAAYLYGHLEPGRVNISQMPFDKEVVDGYARFMKTVQAQLSMGRKEQDIAVATQREFGSTFYWFYYFVRNLETY